MEQEGKIMTQIIINNTSNDYFDVFQTDLFTRPTTGRPLNWLENESRVGKEQQEDNDETGEKDDRND